IRQLAGFRVAQARIARAPHAREAVARIAFFVSILETLVGRSAMMRGGVPLVVGIVVMSGIACVGRREAEGDEERGDRCSSDTHTSHLMSLFSKLLRISPCAASIGAKRSARNQARCACANMQVTAVRAGRAVS